MSLNDSGGGGGGGGSGSGGGGRYCLHGLILRFRVCIVDV